MISFVLGGQRDPMKIKTCDFVIVFLRNQLQQKQQQQKHKTAKHFIISLKTLDFYLLGTSVNK